MTGPYFQVRPEFSSDLPLLSCPATEGLGVLGRKWVLPIMRSIAYHSNVRFSDILHNNPGLTPRALSLTLKELQRSNLIVRLGPEAGPRDIFYELTEPGKDVIPVLTALAGFALKHLPHQVFADGRPRTLGEFLPKSPREMLGDLADYAKLEGSRAREPPAPVPAAPRPRRAVSG